MPNLTREGELILTKKDCEVIWQQLKYETFNPNEEPGLSFSAILKLIGQLATRDEQ